VHATGCMYKLPPKAVSKIFSSSKFLREAKKDVDKKILAGIKMLPGCKEILLIFFPDAF
jgi:hypothetical protein